MSLKVYEHLEQGSSDWLQTRCGIVTASVIGQLVTASTLKPAKNDKARALIAHLAGERITGHVEETYQSQDMLRGQLDEPYARNVYAEHNTPVEEIGFMTSDLGDGVTIGYSPDGLVGEDGLIEIKSRRPKVHVLTILADKPPAENYAQLQCGLLVSGRKWIDYCSYSSGMPFWVRRVYPDPAYQEALVGAAKQAEKDIKDAIATYAERTKDAPPTQRIDHFEGIVIK